MKKVLILIMGIVSSICLSAQNMPYILKYKVDKSKLNNYYYPVQEGDTTIYHNASNIDYLYINGREHSLRFKNYEREEIPISAIDTVYVYHDKFQRFENPQNWTEILFSTEQIYFYKENALTGQPEALLMVTQNDTIPQGQYSYVSFDDNGQPQYMNVNGQHFFIEKIYDGYYDALVINPDSSFFYADRIPLQSHSSEASVRVIRRSAYTQSNAQNAVSLLNHFIGGVTMVEGGVAILEGCSMLVPGANIAVGATIAIAGAATFIAGALTTARATDQLVSDGSHTEGFDVASNILGVGGIIGGKGTVASKIRNIALNEGYAGAQAVLDANTDMYEAYARAMRIVEGRLTTGRAELFNIQSNAIMLYGNITRKMNVHDKVGIMISEDKNALTVKNCMYSENSETGEFTALFDELTPTQEYYYRAYYYATEFDTEYYNPYFVSSVKSFVMPGVKTLNYETDDDENYTVYGLVEWPKNSTGRIVGVCYSEENELPTIEDDKVEETRNNSGKFSLNIRMSASICYYRFYAYINNEIVYGEPAMILSSDDRKMLIRLYKDTKGDRWNNKNNWCSEHDLCDWYGVETTSYNNNRCQSISVPYNNLNGKVFIHHLYDLNKLDIFRGNVISSIRIQNCYLNHMLENLNSNSFEQVNIYGYSVDTLLYNSSNISINQLNLYDNSIVITNAACSIENLSIQNGGCRIVNNSDCNIKNLSIENGGCNIDGLTSKMQTASIINCGGYIRICGSGKILYLTNQNGGADIFGDWDYVYINGGGGGIEVYGNIGRFICPERDGGVCLNGKSNDWKNWK